MKGVEKIIFFVFAVVAIVILFFVGMILLNKGQGLSNPILDMIKNLASALTGKSG